MGRTTQNGSEKKKEKNVYNTWCSQAVTHLSTNHARRCLTSVIGREPVFSTWYGRRRMRSARQATYTVVGSVHLLHEWHVVPKTHTQTHTQVWREKERHVHFVLLYFIKWMTRFFYVSRFLLFLIVKCLPAS